MEARIQKILSQAGVCSRRQAEKWIVEGRVLINGKKATLGSKADREKDKILVNGKPIRRSNEVKYIMLYKPRGYVTTMKDEFGRKTVRDLVTNCKARVLPAGRLDYDSEGLLLLSNDGDFLQQVTHPSHEISKQYIVRVRGALENIPQMSEPMEIDQRTIQAEAVSVLEQDETSAKLRVVIHEGRNRQIRKMCEHCGLIVRRLKRIAIGKIELDSQLKPGQWRELTETEKNYLLQNSVKA